jgi:hypothetical protein
MIFVKSCNWATELARDVEVIQSYALKSLYCSIFCCSGKSATNLANKIEAIQNCAIKFYIILLL